MTHASLFSGIGGFDLAAQWCGWTNVFQCEIDPFCQRILKYHFKEAKLYGDIKKTDFTMYRGTVDVLSAGFPCQPFSTAGRRRGAGDDRYLWPEVIRVIREVRPAWFVGENVAGITSMVQPGSEVEVESSKALFGEDYRTTVRRQQYVVESICGDIEQAGYSVVPVVIPACAVGAPHRRDRVFFIAHRADAGIEGVQRGRENGVYESATSAHADGNDSGRYGHGETEGTNGEIEGKRTVSGNGQPVDFGGEGTVAHANQLNGDIPGFCTSEIPQFEASGVLNNTLTHANSGVLEWRMQNGKKNRTESLCCPNVTHAAVCGRLQDNENEPAGQPEQNIHDWRNFPTQSPICRRNDGFPGGLAGITFPRWRRESIQAFGNAIVPQVAYEIFKKIDQIKLKEKEI